MKSRPTQFGVRENTASSRQHVPRLSASPSFHQFCVISLSKLRDKRPAQRMSPSKEHLACPSPKRENESQVTKKEIPAIPQSLHMNTEDNLPLLLPCEPNSEQPQRRNSTSRVPSGFGTEAFVLCRHMNRIKNGAVCHESTRAR